MNKGHPGRKLYLQTGKYYNKNKHGKLWAINYGQYHHIYSTTLELLSFYTEKHRQEPADLV